ncbi:MAG: NAD-dependent epimerase/dehydratase family protein [Acidobacteria bacterium]|nr:MAG: NAD-dependent epimerase/dehydratase family protein [Acidobacteriota bacterium]
MRSETQEAGDRPRSALVLGASGLVGGHLLRRLLDDATWGLVRAVVRRPLAVEHPRLEQRVVDFDRLERHADAFAVADVFCCLGTTMKKAGSRDAFRRVDYLYPFEAARLAEAAGADRFQLVSSLGADPASGNFYLRVKGEVERVVARLAFGAFDVFRPSILLGERPEPRPAEALAAGFGRALAVVLIGPLRRYRPIPAAMVAAAMVEVAARGEGGHHVYESEAIYAIARRARRRASRRRGGPAGPPPAAA